MGRLMNGAPPCALPQGPSMPARAHVRAKLFEALRRAEASRAPVLARLHVALPDCDPWQLQAICQGGCAATGTTGAPKVPSFLWHDGPSGLCAAAWGEVLWHPLPGQRPFAAAQACCAAWREQVMDMDGSGTDGADGAHDSGDIDTQAPWIFAAFAFDNPEEARATWEALSTGALFVPAQLVYRRTGKSAAGTRAILCAQITPGHDAPAEAEALCDAWAALLVAGAPSRMRGDASIGTSCRSHSPLPRLLADHNTATPAQWARRVDRAQAAMAEGLVTKVVLARQRAVEAPAGYRFDTAATLRVLRAQHPQAVTYAVSRGDGLTFLGATPEVLVRVRGRALATQAVAGTAPRGATPDEDRALGEQLLRSPKDRYEHALLADSLARDLAAVCSQVTRHRAPRLLRLARLQHLETPFTATLRQTGGVLSLCARLHPTPATGGSPQAPVKAWLRAHEPVERGLFAGPIGWLGARGDGTFAVALRGMLLSPSRALAFAGAGIVPASEAKAEWREIDLKLTTALDALRLHPHALAEAPTQAVQAPRGA